MTRPRVMTKGAVCRESAHNAVADRPHRRGFANGGRPRGVCLDGLGRTFSPAREHYLLPSATLPVGTGRQ
jgi:hypothetical protein